MLEKNKDYVLEVISQGYEGEGIAKLEGFPIFIQGSLKGEKIKAKIIKVNKNYAYGKLLEVLETAPNRKEPVCSIYKKCGGCQLQHLSYEGQLEFKKERVEDCLRKIGRLNLDNIKVHDTLGMKEPYRYRNKVQLPVGEKDGNVIIGFYAPRSHDIIDMELCHIQDPVADKVVALTRAWMKKHNIKAYDENNPKDKMKDGKSSIRHIMIRRGFKTGEVMVVIVTSSEYLPYKEEFINTILQQIEGVTSIIQNVNSKNTNVILGEKCITLWGKDTISDYIGEFKFNISPLSFFQVNPIQTEVLYNKALEYAALKGDETVFDAYCGTGTISLFLSQKAKKVYGVEIVPEAIENANINARENHIDNAEFIVGESEKVIPELIDKGIRAEVVVVDPPRKGCGRELLEAIGKMAPERVVYVSCDPSTLARDLGILEQLGYKTMEVQPVDMFPQTGHTECCVSIERVKG